MNVTNRRKSTDADTPTTQPTQQQQQQHQSLLAYVSCRQAATATTSNRSRHDQLLLQQQHQQHPQYKEDDEEEDEEEDEEQDQVVTSTSSDCGVLPLTAEGEGEEVTLDLEATLVTSPARITSSTHNYEHLTYNTDSLSLEEMPVMPTTSENARLDKATETSALKLIQNSINNNNTRSPKAHDMVARDTSLTSVAEAGADKGPGAGRREASFNEQASTSSTNSEVTTENHKLILKLPKSSTINTESQQNSLMEDDLRKVEPLKINLHNTSHHLSSLQHHTPKITIKPIVKNPANDIMVSSAEECSSSAEEEMVSKLHSSEPHIVPKLTIRAKNEELGMTHSTVVPKLTIKINDSSNTIDNLAHNQPAASTPPLPKLTIKTGQDGHSESIITNISPASSTTSSSSSSLASSSSSCLTLTKDTSSVPKFTIKPLHKPHDSTAEDKSHPSIPKLCIKGNMICGSDSSSVNTEEGATTTNKIPKLTIKTGQEHAVIITQHNDHTSAGGITGIPKLTIKTKSLEVNEESSSATSNAKATENSPNEKIPKITIKTNTNETPNIVNTTKQRIIKPLLEQPTTPLSPKQQAVPKLTISRQQNDMVVTNKHTLLQPSEEAAAGTIPKMTIKTQSKTETVPKLMIKTINKTKKRPSTTEESGISDDNEEEDEEEEEEIYKKADNVAQQTKTVPKLTIKNLGSPQQKLKVVQNQETITTTDLTTKSNPLPLAVTLQSNSSSTLIISSSPRDIDEFADLLMVDTCAEESSNSQEFCGFNDNTADSSAAKHNKQSSHNANNVEDPEMELEIRRNSDDMDIDEDLQTEHEPQIFQNVNHYTTATQDQATELLNGKAQLPLHPNKMAQIIDTVDLTSSPSRSSSPTQFDYNDDSNPPLNLANNIPSTNILMERLQRETTVIQTTQHLQNNQTHLESVAANIPPPLQPKPPINIETSPASLKYPQLAERLMANGSSPTHNKTKQSPELPPTQNPTENIIDSIEILDTPEGSPRNSLDECPESLKVTSEPPSSLPNGLHYPPEMDIIITQHNNNNSSSNLKRPALVNNLAGQTHTSRGEMNTDVLPPSKLRRLNNDTPKNNQTIVNNNNDNLLKQKVFNNSFEDLSKATNASPAAEPKTTTVTMAVAVPAVATTTPHQRARKQKHEHIIPIAMEEVNPTNSNDSFELHHDTSNDNTNENSTPVMKKRGRPKKITSHTMDGTTTPLLQHQATPLNKEDTPQPDLNSKSRRVQLLRKRLAIDMVDAEQPLAVLDELESSSHNNAVATAALVAAAAQETQEREDLEQQRRDRSLRTPLRTSRRSNTPSMLQMEQSRTKTKAPSSSLSLDNNNKKSLLKQTNENVLNHFLESNSSISSVCSNTSSTLTSTLASASVQQTLNSTTLSLSHTQIDLTMSSSSSNSNGSTTNTITTVEATHSKQQHSIGLGGGGGSSNNSMLPPTTILSSEPLPDVIFKPNDFSSIIATQQLRAPLMNMDQSESQDEDVADDNSCPDNSGDDSASSSSMSNTPGRGRVRGRGSRGGRGRGYKAHRLGRGASAVSKAIAISRPRCVGALKHTPDPDRMKGLYSPSPSVFEEDTRMSADMSQNNSVQIETPQIPFRQPDFLNNEESQSSIISNTSILDPNTVAAVQNGSQSSAVKKIIKRKKMEVCVAEDADITVSSIAEYDWPPPKGCCPSKNRDTFMIQEQVALYLGIKSFKRKYPDLPRRQIDMEERNYLQEKSLVSEKMCDLGITAVWASDILDIMYTDFYDKYEEYKDFVRQKHLREIEAKQKSLGLNVAGRGLQARERAMLSTSKWNAYFNRTRKEERISCLDLQTLTVNKPCPASAPIAAIPYRPIADAVALAAKAEKIPEPPTLLKPLLWEPIRAREAYYPLSLVPGQFCKDYYDYSAQELRQFPLNTVLDNSSHTRPQKQNITDTDSAAETLEMADKEQSSNTCAAERLNQQRRVRRTRAKHVRKLNNEEFKVPPVPGAISATSSTDSCSSSDESSSETDSDSSSSSSSSSDDSSEDENSPATCGVCQHPQNRNLKDIPELFVQCYTCRRKVHPSCIEMPHRMSTRVRNYNWQCADCKCCIKCKRKQDQNKMLFCEQCDRGFHVYCLGVKAVPDGRWSCERCSICMRCGATKPEGLPLISATGEKIKQVKHKKVKWINDYRIDHITKLREHCSMLCVPCGRTKTTKRVQINTHNNTTNIYTTTSPGSNSGLSPSSSPANATTTTTSLPQMSPSLINSANAAITNISNNIKQAANNSSLVTTSLITPASASTSSSLTSSSANSAINTTAISLESKDSTSITNSHSTSSSSLVTTTPQLTNNTTTTSAAQANATTLTSNPPLALSSTNTASSTSATTTTTVGGPPPVVA